MGIKSLVNMPYSITRKNKEDEFVIFSQYVINFNLNFYRLKQ